MLNKEGCLKASLCGSLPQCNERYRISTQNGSSDVHWVTRRLATPGSKSIKMQSPGTANTVTATLTARWQRTYLSSDRQPERSQSSPPAIADWHELCQLHCPSSLDQLCYGSIAKPLTQQELDSAKSPQSPHTTATLASTNRPVQRSLADPPVTGCQCTGVWLHKRPFSVPTVPHRLPRSLPACLFD
jgi:hypothetical protein